VPRILPPRPSLEQLRNQARELLRACRAGDTRALELLALRLPSSPQPPRLAHAQAALAREYGFLSWTKLRQHVESLLAAPSAVRAAPQLRGAARIALIAEGLLAAARERRLGELFAQLCISKRDGDAVRELMARQGSFAVMVDALLDAAESPRDRLRFLAAQAMDHFADQRCEPVLRRLLRDPVPRVRWAALHSIQCEACKLAPLALKEDMLATIIDMALGDPSVRVRRVATYELGQVCADPRARAALQTIVVESTDQAVLRKASRAIGRL
jgi:hypothetical protein